MISRFLSSSPESGSVLTAWSLEPASDFVCVCVSLSLSAPPLLMLTYSLSLKKKINIKLKKSKEAWGTWVAQSVKRPTSAQVMISEFMGSSPASGSALTAPSLDPTSDSVSPSFSSLPSLVLSL